MKVSVIELISARKFINHTIKYWSLGCDGMKAADVEILNYYLLN